MVFVVCKETGAPGENQRGHGENIHTHKVPPARSQTQGLRAVRQHRALDHDINVLHYEMLIGFPFHTLNV